MTHRTILAREEAQGLGLGWLLAITLGGGALLFVCVGLLMAWRINHLRQPSRTTVYARPVNDVRGLPTRLTKRRLVETTGLPPRPPPTRLASHLSLGRPPVLPPLPTYNSFSFIRSPSHRRHQSEPWLDDDDGGGAGEGGGQAQRSRKSLLDRRFSRDTWFGRARTLPNLASAEEGAVMDLHPQPQPPPPPQREHPYRQQPQAMAPLASPAQDIEVHKRQHAWAQPDVASTVPVLQTALDNVPPPPPMRDRARPVPSLIKSWQPVVSDGNLRDILRSTDERFRDRSRGPSPVKTPQSSPAKTPRSCRTPSSRAAQPTPSPTKQGGTAVNAAATTTMVTTAGQPMLSLDLGVAAESLITEAVQELELPGGLSSPSRRRSQEQEPQDDQEWQSQRSPIRSPESLPSSDSDASSSLSTLYSVGEPEEGKDQQPRQQKDRGEETGTNAAAAARSSWQDPFVGNAPLKTSSWQSKPQLSGPRPLRRIQTSSPRTLQIDPELQLTCSTSSSLSLSSTSSSEYTIRAEDEEAMGARGPQRRAGAAGGVSESSFTSDSVHSATEPDSDSDAPQMAMCETPRRALPHGNDGRRTSITSSATPTKRLSTASVASSSPYNEHDILSMLLSKSAPRRALPRPPTTVTAPDGSVVATPLSPRPRDHNNNTHNGSNRSNRTPGRGAPSPSLRAAEHSASGSPSRRPPSRSARDHPQTLGSTIAELRRMNSMVSSYSAVSASSTAQGGGVDTSDSPPLPSVANGVAAAVQPRSILRPGTIGSRHYLNIGNSPPKHRPNQHNKSASADGRSGAAPRPANDRDRDRVLQHQQRRDSGAGVGKEQQVGKKNQSLETAKAPRVDWGPPPVPGLKNPRRSANRDMLVPLPGSNTAPLSSSALSVSGVAGPTAGPAPKAAAPVVPP